MISSKTLRNAAAATLVTLVGTGPAYAAIEISSTGTVTNAVVVAKETITTAAEREVGANDAKYFSIISTGTAASLLAIETPLGFQVNATGDTATLQYTFSGGMRWGFAAAVAADVLTYQADGTTAITGGTRTVRVGGSEGDAGVTVQISGVALPATAKVRLVIEYLTFPSSGGANQSGGVTVAANLNSTPPIGNTIVAEDILRVVTGINDKVTPRNQAASSSSNFLTFAAGDTVTNEGKTARFGQIDLGIAAVSGPTPGSTLILRNRGTGVITDDAAGRTALSTARVGITGGLSFVERAYLSDATCATSGSFNLLDANGAWKTEAARATIAQAYNRYLCIEVDGETPITSTEYMATIDNTKISDAIFDVSDQDGLSLGAIGRDGTSVRIPFLSTFTGYNHRLILTNEGATEATYRVTFSTEGDATATALARATGTVAANSTITIPVGQLVRIEGGARTAATVMAEGQLGVATVLINQADGSSDTVVYQEED